MTAARLVSMATLLLLGGLACDEAGPGGRKADTGDTMAEPTRGSTTDVLAGGCADLCSQASSAGAAEGDCAARTLQGLGYDVLGAPVECAAIAGNEIGCGACMTELQVSDADCDQVSDACL